MKYRKPTYQELKLIDFLVKLAEPNMNATGFSDALMVTDMADGNMGSLRLYPDATVVENSAFGKQASACQFADVDGIDVIASLNVDQFGGLYELDLWKTDYSTLLQLPEDMTKVQPMIE
ncbi:DUF6984 family protein [Candidatus Thiothrix anitrata]|uniref:DUF6984 domain-containing protein n=1 Tax=Candidatus Thiothrix anitrata TaxID=2823902 RepID=A0ABX7X2T5_9GAMM|nr:hypothetical protein [Candidatus Thiothrix anitrata]QTR48983.1 hypothetical protein J8380_11940 [Candidatus Thiothrix anitrata]